MVRPSLYSEGPGTAEAGPPLSVSQRSGGTSWPGTPQAFLAYAITYEGDDCLEWPFAKVCGYGTIKVNQKAYKVCRLVLEATVGPAPAPGRAYHAAHAPIVCHNRACVNPRHLRWATAAENLADRRIDGTFPRGETSGRAKLTEADVRAIRADTRTSTAIAIDYGVSQVLVSRIRRGEAWTHIL